MRSSFGLLRICREIATFPGNLDFGGLGLPGGLPARFQGYPWDSGSSGSGRPPGAGFQGLRIALPEASGKPWNSGFQGPQNSGFQGFPGSWFGGIPNLPKPAGEGVFQDPRNSGFQLPPGDSWNSGFGLNLGFGLTCRNRYS